VKLKKLKRYYYKETMPITTVNRLQVWKLLWHQIFLVSPIMLLQVPIHLVRIIYHSRHWHIPKNIHWERQKKNIISITTRCFSKQSYNWSVTIITKWYIINEWWLRKYDGLWSLWCWHH
jgi:hypothetical protein